MRYVRNSVWGWLLMAACMVGCGKEIPKDIIQPAEMENVLYDYHLGISMSGNLSYSDNYQKEAYRNYVFDKHRITAAEFDSSMVWYTRHTEELAAIYKKLGERFRNEKKHVENLIAVREKKPAVSQPGDTVDVWYDRKLYWLAKGPLTNRVTFEIPSDSNFKAKDAFLWSADYIFLSDHPGQKAVMGFNVQFENDSVAGSVREITASGAQSLYIKPDSAFAIKSLNGFIYYTEADSANALGLIVNKITLMRYHEPADTTSVAEKKDSLTVEKPDTVITRKEAEEVQPEVSPEKQQPVRMNPREMKENTDRPQRIRRKN